MGTYVGFVSKAGYGTIYYNFKPIAEITALGLEVLSPEKLTELLPESKNRDINFAYSFFKPEHNAIMESFFRKESLCVFEFEFKELQDNFRQGTDERNQTGYRVSCIELINSGRIRFLDSEGYYKLIKKDDIISDFLHDIVVDIRTRNINENELVYIEHDNFIAGPYKIGYRPATDSFYIKPQIKENRYIVSGYQKSNIRSHSIYDSEGYRDEAAQTLYSIKTDAERYYKDVIETSTLIDSFKESIINLGIKNQSIDVTDFEKLVSHYNDSCLSGDFANDAIRKERLNKLVNILSNESDLDDTLGYISDILCDLLIRNKDNSNVNDFLESIIKNRPDFQNLIRDYSSVNEQIYQLKQQLEILANQRDDLNKEIDQKRQEASSIDQEALEAKKSDMIAMDSEYSELKEKIDNAKTTLNLTDDIVNLTQRIEKLNKEHEDCFNRNYYLKQSTTLLETQFAQMINNQHSAMASIAFDGFMSSKMLNAAAQWESEESDRDFNEFVSTSNNVPVTDKTPSELIEYLCKTIQSVRPNYNKNIIINIAICITQNLLTVFSGDPGCGKTSICNIFAEALGLNQFSKQIPSEISKGVHTSRYVQVSVERGWTSKRDLIGYYNPLSKSFDKSNRMVFDALNQLNIEHKKNINKFPYAILLDEANLSPMEYYWADFMNICDDIQLNNLINLGENHVFSIPETLHFIATINNDHTTETLSPRLIDRAWIITLPQEYTSFTKSEVETISNDLIEIITWKSLSDAFIPKEIKTFSPELEKCYESVLAHLRKMHFYISPRTSKAIIKYWSVASVLMEKNDYGTEPDIVALDYAITQKILPKIEGHGENFEAWLKDLQNLFNSNSLTMSAAAIKNILERGDENMQYYKFFG